MEHNGAFLTYEQVGKEGYQNCTHLGNTANSKFAALLLLCFMLPLQAVCAALLSAVHTADDLAQQLAAAA
jgi:hypothetical protein